MDATVKVEIRYKARMQQLLKMSYFLCHTTNRALIFSFTWGEKLIHSKKIVFSFTGEEKINFMDCKKIVSSILL